MAALTQEDDKLQIPMISNVGNEIWKCKEAGQPIEEAPTLGDPERRGILMETVAAVSYLLSGADVVILRHPESVRLTRSFIELMANGGVATDVDEISKRLELKEPDLISLSPKPDLTIAEEKAPVKEKVAKPEKKEAAPKPEKKEEKPKAAPRPEEKIVELRPKAEEKLKVEAEEKAKAEAEAKAKAEAEEKAKAEAQAKAKAEAEAKVRVEAAEKAKAEAEAEAKAKAEAEEKAKEKEDLQALRYKRALERENLETERKALEGKKVPKRPAGQQLTPVDKLIQDLDRIHRRV